MSQDLMNNDAIQEALKKFAEKLSQSDLNDRKPFDGVFYIEDMNQTLEVSPRATMEELEQMVQDVEDKKNRLAELANWLDRNTGGDPKLAAELLGLEKNRRENENKLKTPCKLRVWNDKIKLVLPDKNEEDVSFVRNIGNTLYIFFLRQIERAEADPNVPRSLSQKEMVAYKEELMDIYQNISGKVRPMSYIEKWLNVNGRSNDFSDATAHIRTYFASRLDVLALKYKYDKCYSIEKMDKDRDGNDRYGIGLDTSDFDLGWYSMKQGKI